MEKTKPLADVDVRDLAVVERLFGQPINSPGSMVLVLKSTEDASEAAIPTGTPGIPDWCDVLEGMSDEDLIEFQKSLSAPVRLGRANNHGA